MKYKEANRCHLTPSPPLCPSMPGEVISPLPLVHLMPMPCQPTYSIAIWGSSYTVVVGLR